MFNATRINIALGTLVLAGLVSCSKTERETLWVDREYANLCESYEAIARLALQLHLTQKETSFDRFRDEALRQAVEAYRLNPSLGEAGEPCGTFDRRLSENSSLKKEEFYQSALAFFLRELDPHSVYLSPPGYDRLELFQSQKREDFGIAFKLRFRDYFLPLKRLAIEEVSDSDDLRSVVEEGDEVVAVNAKPVENALLKNIYEEFKGKDRISLDIEGKGEKELKRSTHTFPPVSFHRVESEDGRYLYLKIRNFEGGVVDYFNDVVSNLKLSDYDGVILDLRGNPGGLLDESIHFLSLTAQEPTSVKIEGSRDKQEVAKRFSLNKSYDIEPEKNIFGGLPKVVLIDPRTASAAEIVTLGLQPWVQVVGSYSMGKGTGQQLFKLSAKNKLGGAMLVTMFRYYVRDNDTPQLVGVPPKILTLDQELMDFMDLKENKSLVVHEYQYKNAISRLEKDQGQKDPEETYVCENPSLEDCELKRAVAFLDFERENS